MNKEEVLEKIADILKKIESEKERIILDERKLASQPKEIEAKVYTALPEGGILKRIFIPVCDYCGSRLDGNFYICSNCHRKLCFNCAYKYHQVFLCLDCLQKLLPLDKQEYKILFVISNGFTEIKRISEITKIRIEEVTDRIKNLIESGMLERKGVSIFSTLSLTDKGLEALGVYEKAYGKDADVIQLTEEIGRTVSEKS